MIKKIIFLPVMLSLAFQVKGAYSDWYNYHPAVQEYRKKLKTPTQVDSMHIRLQEKGVVLNIATKTVVQSSTNLYALKTLEHLYDRANYTKHITASCGVVASAAVAVVGWGALGNTVPALCLVTSCLAIEAGCAGAGCYYKKHADHDARMAILATKASIIQHNKQPSVVLTPDCHDRQEHRALESFLYNRV